MTYQFLQKAKIQPDLTDIVEYLTPSLSTLEEIIEKTSLGQKTIESSDIQRKAHNILNKYLPGLIENYCQFSFQYRNTETIKSEVRNGIKVHYTPKQLLLHDIGKIIEEIKVLEKEFNEGSRFHALVGSRFIAEVTTPAYQIETTLENKVTYSTPYLEQPIKIPYIDTFEKAPDLEPKKSSKGIFLEMGLTLGVAGLIILSMVGQHTSHTEKLKETYTGIQISKINHFAKNFYGSHLQQQSHQTTKEITIKDFIEYRVFSKEEYNDNHIVGAYGPIFISPAEKNSYKITLTNIPASSCLRISTDYHSWGLIQVDGQPVGSEEKINQEQLSKHCQGDVNTIDFIEKL